MRKNSHNSVSTTLMSVFAALLVYAALVAGNAPDSNSGSGSSTPGTNLSERLDRSQGVIAPPQNVDPAMRVVPPSTSDKIPVIPPPGSPGGNPHVVQK